MARIAIVGAGVSGLRCGSELRARRHGVVVFEKSRGLGGRASTRRSEQGEFDHGAQYFTARNPQFAREVEDWIATGDAAEWMGRIVSLQGGHLSEFSTDTTRRFVAVPGMSALGKLLAADLGVRTAMRVERLERTASHWVVHFGDGATEAPFDAVVLAIPAAQAEALLPGDSALAARVREVRIEPCVALMAHYSARLDLPFDGAFIRDGTLSWVARNGSKPGRGSEENWVLHAGPGWSAAHFERDSDWQTRAMLDGFEEAAGQALPRPAATAVHGWRYARPASPLLERYLFDANTLLGACGDWCGESRVEGAYLSGTALADVLSQALDNLP